MTDDNNYAWGGISGNYYGYVSQCYSGHRWVETGSRKVWCKDCDADGELDPMTGVVTIVTRPKQDKKP